MQIKTELVKMKSDDVKTRNIKGKNSTELLVEKKRFKREDWQDQGDAWCRHIA